MGDWDQKAANVAYTVQIEAAEAEEREREAAEAAWLAAYQAQYGMLPPVEPSAGSGGGGGGGGGTSGGGGGVKKSGRGRGRPPADGGAAHHNIDTAMSTARAAIDHLQNERRRRKRRTGPLPLPWEPQEDFVLTSVTALLLEGGELPGPGLWVAASDALGAGAAAVSVTGVDSAARQGRRRTPDVCGARYAQLRAAYRAATHGEKENLTHDAAAVRMAIGTILGSGGGGDNTAPLPLLPGSPDSDTIAAVYNALLGVLGTSPCAATLLHLLHSLRGAVAQIGGMIVVAAQSLPQAPPGAPVAGPVAEAQAIAAAVRQGCGSGAARMISTRLPTIVQAARVGGAGLGLDLVGGGDAHHGHMGDADVQYLAEMGLEGLDELMMEQQQQQQQGRGGVDGVDVDAMVAPPPLQP